MITIITVVLALSFLIFIHELGHYLAARSVGVHVIEFSIGFPPKVVSKIIGKTEYLISLVPIGGYVRLKGQNIEDEDPDDPENYAAKSISQRLLILVSGPLMNFITALVFISIVFFIGYEVPEYLDNPPVIGDITKNSEAERLDIQKNDLVLSINDHKVHTWKEAESVLQDSPTPVIRLELQRGNEKVLRSFNSRHLKQPGGFGWSVKIDPVIGKISADSPAESAGFLIRDRIIKIDNIPVDNWTQISPLVQSSKGKELVVSIIRNNDLLSIAVTPTREGKKSYWYIGVSSQMKWVSEGFIDSIVLGSKRVYLMTVKTFEFLYRMIMGKEDMDSVGGPIMIAKMMGQAAERSFSSLLSLVAFISLQFAIFNLLPIPALDGGHIFFLLIEKIKGSALSKNFRNSAQVAGFLLLILLIIGVSIKDGARLFQ